MLSEQIGTNIRRLRQENAMTQSRLAELLCVSHQMISRYETGITVPDIGTLVRLSGIFHVSLDILCGLAVPDTETLIQHLQQTYTEKCYETYTVLSERYTSFLQESEPVSDDDRVLYLQLSLLANMHDNIQTNAQHKEVNEMILECASRILDISRDDPLRSLANYRLAVYYDETPFDSPDYPQNMKLSREYAQKVLLCTYFPAFSIPVGIDMKTDEYPEIKKKNLCFFGKKFRCMTESMLKAGLLPENTEKYIQLTEKLLEMGF